MDLIILRRIPHPKLRRSAPLKGLRGDAMLFSKINFVDTDSGSDDPWCDSLHRYHLQCILQI